MTDSRQHSTQLHGAPQGEALAWPQTLAIAGMIGAFSLSIGYMYPAIGFNLEASGYSPLMIGALGAMSGIGVLMSSLFAPALASIYGTRRVSIWSVVISSFAIAAFAFVPPIAFWFPLRLILGAAGSLIFVMGETWLIQITPRHLRGRVLGGYTAWVAGIFALGPAMIPIVGFTGALPYLSIAGIVLVMGLPLFVVRGEPPPVERIDRRTLFATMSLIPVVLLSVAAFGFFDSAVLGLWAVFALDGGLDTDRAAWLLTVLVLGNVILQVPIGWLAERTSTRGVLIMCCGFGFLGAAGLYWLDLSSGWAVPYFFFWGALAFGTYTLALMMIGEHLTGGRLVAANAAFGVMWGVGALAGSAITGGLMDLLGNSGFGLAIGGIYGLLFLTTLLVRPVRN